MTSKVFKPPVVVKHGLALRPLLMAQLLPSSKSSISAELLSESRSLLSLLLVPILGNGKMNITLSTREEMGGLRVRLPLLVAVAPSLRMIGLTTLLAATLDLL